MAFSGLALYTIGDGVAAVSVAMWRTLESLQARLGKFILQVPRSTQNVSTIVGCGFEPIKIIHMDRVYSLALRMQDSESDLVQEALQVMEAQGDLFFRQVGEMNEGMEAWEDYAGYREGQLEQHVVRSANLV